MDLELVNLGKRIPNTKCANTIGLKTICTDNSTVTFCWGGMKIFSWTCPQWMPTCNPTTGSCRPMQSTICTVDGYFPMQGKCGSYYICSNRVAYEMSCPVDSFYDHRHRTCRSVRITDTGCALYPCSGNVTAYVASFQDPAKYALCYSGNLIFQDACGANHYFDAIKGVCAKKDYSSTECQGEWSTAAKLETQFTHCISLGNGKLQPYIAPCPGRTSFNITLGFCN